MAVSEVQQNDRNARGVKFNQQAAPLRQIHRVIAQVQAQAPQEPIPDLRWNQFHARACQRLGNKRIILWRSAVHPRFKCSAHTNSASADLRCYTAAIRLRMAISGNSIIVATSTQLASDLGEEIIILECVKGVYFGLNGVGRVVWKQIQSPCRFEAIRDAIMREYEVSADRCEQDLVNLIQELHQQGLVEIRDETTA